MDNKDDIKSIMQAALERELPPAQIDLLPKVRARLVAGNVQQGEKMIQTITRRVSRLALVTLMVVALITLVLITPQGRALAQEVFEFFNRAESYERPLPPEQVVSPEEAQSVPTAAAPAPLVPVAEAEKATGFDAKELPSDPKGFTFVGAMAAQGSISIQYEAQGGGGSLVINESTHGFIQSDWDQAPVEAISQVKVGELDAEIVQGAYVVYPGETVARWNSEAPILRLRWIEDGIWFEMAKFGGVESISYLGREGLIELAESMVYTP